MRISRCLASGIWLTVVCGCFAVVRADEIDELVAQQMREKQIPGLSLAIVSDGKIVWAKGYGFAEESGKVPVTTETLFQAGSISKAVTAVGVLRLVEQHKLDLDTDVNGTLHSWKVPEHEFTKTEKVTVRRLMSHSAGLTVHGFPGYAVSSRIPTLVQVLDGATPANTEAVRVDITPGTKYRYSGGGYTVLQQLVVDVTKKPFPEWMDETVLRSIGMANSTFEQPLPAAKERAAAVGYLANGKAVAGRWHIYPEMAAAGLWTTASDLARFEIALQHAYAGEPNSVLLKRTAREMFTTQMEMFGLGVMLMSKEGKHLLMGKDGDVVFFHGGRDEGFDAYFVATASTGKGVVVMLNKNDNNGAMDVIATAVAKKYAWP